MARVAHREGYPEIGLYWEKAAYEEAEHAAKFAELLGEFVTDSTKKNLEIACRSLRTVLLLVNSTWLNVLKLLTSTQSMTQFMKWLVMRRDTAKHSLVCLRDISENKNII